MSERLKKGDLTFDDYRELAVSTWRSEEHDWNTWPETYAVWVRSEFGELMAQHGPFHVLAYDLGNCSSPEEKSRLLNNDQKMVTGAIEELGDLLWFSTMSANHADINYQTTIQQALEGFLGVDCPVVNSFRELQAAIEGKGHLISVPSKLALMSREGDSVQNDVSIDFATLYVLRRMVSRLARSLDKGQSDVSPKTASMFEDILDLEQSAGSCIVAATYVANTILEVDMETVAKFNIAKLQDRAINSKAK